MNKDIIQKKIAALEVEFKKIEEQRQEAQNTVNLCAQHLLRLQGAHAQLEELEKELGQEAKTEEKKDN